MRAFSSAVAPIAIIAALAFANQSTHAATSWTTASGTSDNITYDSGQTAHGLLEAGSPIVSSDKFVFTPSNFAADSSSAPAVDDLLSVVLHAKSGKSLSRVSADLKGDFSTLGTATVLADAQLKVTNLDTSASFAQSFDFGTSFTSGTEDGLFNGFASILLPIGWRNALVEYSASLNATGQGGVGFIQGKTGQLGVEVKPQVVAVPLPGAALAAIPAIALAWVARRRLAIVR